MSWRCQQPVVAKWLKQEGVWKAVSVQVAATMMGKKTVPTIRGCVFLPPGFGFLGAWKENTQIMKEACVGC